MYCLLLLLILGFGEPMLIFSSTLMFLFLHHYVNPKDFFKRKEEEELELVPSYT
jgi:hypothetical protein